MDTDSSLDGYQTDREREKLPLRGKKKMKAKNRKVYNPQWVTLKPFIEWLAPVKSDKYKAHCKVCNATVNAGKSELMKHADGKAHKANLVSKRNVKTQPAISSFTSFDKKVTRTEIAISLFVTENNLPLSLVENLVPFIQNLPEQNVLQKISLKKQKATNIVRQCLWPHFTKDLVEELNKYFFSIIIDETTDKSNSKQLAIIVTYFNSRTFDVKTDVLDVVACPDGSAKSIYNSLKHSLEEHHLDLRRWVGFCSDTTNVMMGPHNSVATLIKSEYPMVAVIKCSCHMIHLCASYACKTLPIGLEDFCRSVYNHFGRSPKNSEAYKQFQVFYDVKIHKLLYPSQTRWLSLESCVLRIIEQWESLKAYWRLLSMEDPSHLNTLTYKTLNNPIQKCYLLFLKYILGLFNNFNKFFQSQRPMFHFLKGKVEELLKTLCINIYEVSYVRTLTDISSKTLSENQFLPLERIFLGVAAEELLNSLIEKSPYDKDILSEIKKVRESAKNFYLESIKQVKQRFTFDHIFQDAIFLDPSNSRNLVPMSLAPIAKKYVSDFVNIENLDHEWRQQSFLQELDQISCPDDYFRTLSKMNDNGVPKFPNITILTSYFFSLPFSNASVERLFSILNMNKTNLRNRLHDETTAAILAVKQGTKRANVNSLSVLTGKYEIAMPSSFKSDASASLSRNITQKELHDPNH